MIRNSKTLTLAVLLALAVSAVTATGASAATRFFKSEAANTLFAGMQSGNTEFVSNHGAYVCKEATYGGLMAPKTSETLSLGLGYKQCSIGANTNVTIETNDCAFLIHSEVEIGGKVTIATVDIHCEDADGTKTGPIVITEKLISTTKCKITIPEQAGLVTEKVAGVKFTNELPKPTAIFAEFHLMGIAYTQDAGSGAGACSSESGINGTYKGNTKLLGFEEKTLNPVGILYE